jgi:hypothetical protein
MTVRPFTDGPPCQRSVGKFRILALVALLTTVPGISGCAGYRVGNQSLYRPDIRTVHVPVFQSESLRRFLGERLTEAVAKTIELQTPYKVVPHARADSVLEGRIFEESKYVITENANDEVRDIELETIVEVTWRGRGGQVLAGPFTYRLPNGFDRVGQAVHIIPEGGQSIVTGQQETFVRLADQIVASMEVPW